MAAGGLLVFDPEPSLTRAMVATRIAERIHLVPRLRQRLEEAPLGLANPVWVDDGFISTGISARPASRNPEARRSSDGSSNASSSIASTAPAHCGKRP